MSSQLSLNLDNKLADDCQFSGAFVGAAVGDALGFITEFMRSPNDLQKYYAVNKLNNLINWERITRFQSKYTIKLPIPAGTFSDDMQLTLATSRCLTVSGEFDSSAFAKQELSLWLEYQLGGGSGTKAAATNLRKNKIEWHNNFYDTPYTQYIKSGGNGVAMRVLPIALVHSQDARNRYANIWRNAIITHGHVRGIIGGLLFADTVSSLLDKPEQKIVWLKDLIDTCNVEYPKVSEIWKQIPEFPKWQETWEELSKQSFTEAWHKVCEETKSQLQLIYENIQTREPRKILNQLGCYDRNTKGAGNSTVVAGIFFFCRQDLYEDTIVAVANEIGIDTDTIGYFVGAMFGAYQGLESIPQRFRDRIQDYDYLSQMSDWCYRIYSGEAVSQAEFSYPSVIESDFSKNVKEQLEIATVNSDITLPVLGSGKLISDTDITPAWRGKHIHWLKLSLDIGQTVFFQVTRSISRDSTTQLNAQIKPDRQESVVSSLAVLDEFKNALEESNFNTEVLMDTIRNIKFSKKDRAIYNAFMTWLWSALPEGVDAPDQNEEVPEE
ncbi:MAG: ADP-ribosylglycohydrolase family protein [Caldilineaceae bacterium]